MWCTPSYIYSKNTCCKLPPFKPDPCKEIIMETELKELAIDLYKIEAVKFGEFITKVGLKTPIYFDLRVIIAHPKVMSRLSKALWKLAYDSEQVSQLCGVPYTALPLATLISVDNNIPMLIKRKEAKAYGTKKLIEGSYSTGDHCVIIEDVVTSGSSILETVEVLRKEGLKVTEAFVVIDREQGGRKNIENHSIKMKSLYTVRGIMGILEKAGLITAETVSKVCDYLKECQAPVSAAPEASNKRLETSFDARAKLSKNPINQRLFKLMEAKQSTICLAADLTKADAILELADLAGPHIAVFKTHVDIVEDFSPEFITKLKDLAKKHDFLLMEDRKFGDIGNTVSLQYEYGMYRIAEWADLITAHPVAGPSIIDGLKSGLKGVSEPRGVFLIAEMSSKGTLTVGDYIQSSVSIGENSDLVAGFVCQSNIFNHPGLIQLTPGVQLSKSSDTLGQQYNTPETVVNAGADLAVVGRGITNAKEKLAAVLEYKQELWTAYKRRIQ